MPHSASSDPSGKRRKRLLGNLRLAGLHVGRALSRRLSSSLTRRIALLNLAGLLALFLAYLWINQTRLGVIDARSQSLSLQAEMIATAIAGAANREGDVAPLDPETLLQLQLGEAPGQEESGQSWLEFSINPARVAPILKRLVSPTRTRARIFDRDGLLLLDTKAFYSPGDFSQAGKPPDRDDAATLFSRTWNAVRQRFGRIDLEAGEEPVGPRQFPEVQRALKGAPQSLVRVVADGQTIVFSATPIRRGGAVQGALLLSTQEGDVDRIIAEERWGLVLVFLIASAVMLILSILLAGGIADPVRRLSEAADRVRRGIRARHEIPDFSARSDEIGQLSVSLRDMTEALYTRIEAIERFAADVSHELKNPLTSLRSAAETLPLAKTDASRTRLLEVIGHDVKRLDRLITDIADASRLDAELQRAETSLIDLGALLTTVVGMRNDVERAEKVNVRLAFDHGDRPPRPFLLRGHDGRLVQVFSNLIDNAQSFSPEGGEVRLACRRDGIMIECLVDDDGPGIPDHALERIFERFYTDRPTQSFGQNSGLGLSISRQIVIAHGGTIHAENRVDGAGHVLGARFVLRLPAATGTAGTA